VGGEISFPVNFIGTCTGRVRRRDWRCLLSPHVINGMFGKIYFLNTVFYNSNLIQLFFNFDSNILNYPNIISKINSLDIFNSFKKYTQTSHINLLFLF
jgi:hypothetical protein